MNDIYMHYRFVSMCRLAYYFKIIFVFSLMPHPVFLLSCNPYPITTAQPMSEVAYKVYDLLLTRIYKKHPMGCVYHGPSQ